jgi:hypothetical protein
MEEGQRLVQKWHLAGTALPPASSVDPMALCRFNSVKIEAKNEFERMKNESHGYFHQREFER